MLNNIGMMFYRYSDDTEVFVETGTFEGSGLEQAVELGFDDYYSIEYHEPFYEACRKKFSIVPRIHLYHGSSADKLPEVLADVGDRKCFFWLDAHDSFGTGGGVPMNEELAAIKNHSRNDHVIMIDDIPLYFGDGSQLRERLLDINPDYKIVGVDPGIPSRPDYCMVAYL